MARLILSCGAALLCLLSLSAASPRARAQEGSSQKNCITLHFKSVGTLMLVDVRINGQPKRMVFDSGAQRTALNAKTQQDRVLTGVIYIEHNTWFNFPIILTNMTSMFSVLGEGDGVLGQDFMRQFKSVSIDYKAETITLVP